MFVSKSCLKTSSGVSSSDPIAPIPALFTKTLISVWRDIAFWVASSIEVREVMSS